MVATGRPPHIQRLQVARLLRIWRCQSRPVRIRHLPSILRLLQAVRLGTGEYQLQRVPQGRQSTAAAVHSRVPGRSVRSVGSCGAWYVSIDPRGDIDTNEGRRVRQMSNVDGSRLRIRLLLGPLGEQPQDGVLLHE